MTFKKIMSVVLATLMLLTVFSLGFTGMAAEVSLSAQYEMLANDLKKEHVRTLTNYTIENETLDNGAEGFDTEANGFAYEHRVIAADNKAGDILKAANRFYYIAEKIMSTTYGKGLYDANLLVNEVSSKLEPYFENTSGDRSFIDFYGDPKTPTDEELAAYDEAVSLIEATGKDVSEATLTSMGIYFMERTPFEYYNVNTVLQYFMGNVLKINAGNWYHRFAFIVQTSVDTWFIESGDINNLADYYITTRTAAYEISYKRTYNDLGTKSYYSFETPSLNTVWNDYASYYNFSRETAKLDNEISEGSQASALFVKVEKDEQTVAYLATAYSAFSQYISRNYNEETGETWDSAFINGVSSDVDTATLIAYTEDITHDYSNEAIMSMFGDDVGNMITMTYIAKSADSMPSRTVRGTTKYEATLYKLDTIVKDMDALITPRDDSSSDRDNDVATRMANILRLFFNTDNSLFEGTAVEGLEFENIHELVELLVSGLLFRDSIVNLVVQKLYPMVTKALDDLLGNLLGNLPSWVTINLDDLLTKILTNNHLAIKPNTLADRIKTNYGDKYADAAKVLSAAGENWNNVNFEVLSWGVDDAPLADKGKVFADALCAALSGFLLLVVTIMCGDKEYKNEDRTGDLGWNKVESNDDNQFTEYYDKLLINIGQQGVMLRSTGGYTKLIVPLFRVLGLTELDYGKNISNVDVNKLSGFVSSESYHALVDKNGNNALKLIVQPIVYWVQNVLGAKPFETLWNLLPNLVYFFTRTSSEDENLSDYYDEWDDNTSNDESHSWFSNVQNCNLYNCLNSVMIVATIAGIKFYSANLGSLLPSNIKTMLSSINGLLDSVLKLNYNTDTIVEIKPAGYLMKEDYSNSIYSVKAGDLVVVGTDAYNAFKGELFEFKEDATSEYKEQMRAKYTAYDTVYSNNAETTYTTTKDDTHTKEVTNIVYETRAYKLPRIPEAKLISCGTVTADNTLEIAHPGQVLLVVLRYVCSALGYKYDLSRYEPNSQEYDLPFLIECFGLDMNQTLFNGLTLGDIIYNVMLHPDDAICALLEIFYPNENNKGDKANGIAATGDFRNNIGYAYPVSNINYHNSSLLNTTVNPTLTYGTQVTYTKYWTREYAADTVSNAGQLVENVLKMLGLKGFENGIGPFLKNLLEEKLFNNDMVNTIFNALYPMLLGLSDKIDIETILKNALDVEYTPSVVAKALHGMAGESDAYYKIAELSSWTDMFKKDANGNYTKVELDWGLNKEGIDKCDTFLRVVSALASPAAFLIKYLMADNALNVLNLIQLPSYAGYQFAWIALLEALSCTNILTYNEYYDSTLEENIGNANAIYNLVAPIGSLLAKVYVDPINTVLNIIPNLLFFISIGGLNDLLNNVLHFAYVILDILKPIVNGYDILNGLISNIQIGSMTLNLTIPLDVDFNGLISDLVGTLVGDSLTISGVKITLPYIDFHTLCCGTMEKFMSKENRATVHLDSAGGGDLLTAVFRLLIEVIFMQENKEAICKIISNAIGEGKLDVYDEETLYVVINQLFTLMETYDVPDMLLFVVYQLVTKVTPITTDLAPKFAENGLTIQDLINSASDPQAFISNIQKLLAEDESQYSGDEVPDKKAASGLLARIKAFFERIREFFKKLFDFNK